LLANLSAPLTAFPLSRIAPRIRSCPCIESTGHAWLHSRCWPIWHAGRKAEAIAALAALWIAEPTEFADDFGKNEGG
jgi:hypothetical protein